MQNLSCAGLKSALAQLKQWQSQLQAVGSLRALITEIARWGKATLATLESKKGREGLF